MRRTAAASFIVLAHSQVDALKLGTLLGKTQEAPQKRHFDLLVIGGGSGGLAASKAAAELGKKVAVCNFVKPSYVKSTGPITILSRRLTVRILYIGRPQGTTWGLGGTCVNVGCIPKKLMHHAAQLGEARKDSIWYGWEVPDDEGNDRHRSQFLVPEADHSWATLVTNVQNHIKSTNFAYRAQCRSNDVEYLDAFATFINPKTVEAVTKSGVKTTITADDFILCTGGRPRYPDIPGALEHCITSDDVFSMKTPPGKTLVVGGGYVALECAGFINGLGYQTKVGAKKRHTLPRPVCHAVCSLPFLVWLTSHPSSACYCFPLLPTSCRS